MTLQEFYTTIKARIISQCPHIKTVALWRNQFEKMDQGLEDPCLFPAAFIEFVDIQYVSQGNGVQMCLLQISIHCGFESLKIEDLELLNKKNLLHAQLQRWNAAGFGALDRYAEKIDVGYTNIVDHQIMYNTQFVDSATYNENKLVSAGEVSVELDIDLKIDNLTVRTGRITG